MRDDAFDRRDQRELTCTPRAEHRELPLLALDLRAHFIHGRARVDQRALCADALGAELLLPLEPRFRRRKARLRLLEPRARARRIARDHRPEPLPLLHVIPERRFDFRDAP
jgi:hypothetical protein